MVVYLTHRNTCDAHGPARTMSFPLKLDVVSSKDVKSKKRWKHVQWDGEESENVSLLGSKTLAQFDLVTGKKRRVDASLRRVLGEVVCITGSLSGSYIFAAVAVYLRF